MLEVAVNDYDEMIARMDPSVREANAAAIANAKVMSDTAWQPRNSSVQATSVTENALTAKSGVLPLAEGGRAQSKYRNVKCEFDGHKFDSLVERDRYIHLKADPNILDLKCQQKLRYALQGTVLFTLIVDFSYRLKDDEFHVHEDVKGGATTAVFRLKKKMIQEMYKITIREVRWRDNQWIVK